MTGIPVFRAASLAVHLRVFVVGILVLVQSYVLCFVYCVLGAWNNTRLGTKVSPDSVLDWCPDMAAIV